MKTFKYLQLNADLGGKKKGEIIRIECTKVVEKGKETRYIPIERYWRDRLKDAKTDNCVEFVDEPKLTKEGGKPGEKDAKSKGSKK